MLSLGNVSSFLDIYIEYDMAHGLLDEAHAQELIDQFVIKLRMVRHLRMQAYTDIFAGDPTWVTESIGGRFNDGRTKVTKTSFRSRHCTTSVLHPNRTLLFCGVRNCRKASRDSVHRYLSTPLLSSMRTMT